MPTTNDPACTIAHREDQLARVRSRVVGLFNSLIDAKSTIVVDASRWTNTKEAVRLEVRGLHLSVCRSRLGLRQGFEVLIYHPGRPNGEPIAAVFVPDAIDGPVRANALSLDPGAVLADGGA